MRYKIQRIVERGLSEYCQRMEYHGENLSDCEKTSRKQDKSIFKKQQNYLAYSTVVEK